MRNELITIRVTAREKKMAVAMAQWEDVSMSELIRSALKSQAKGVGLWPTKNKITRFSQELREIA